MILSTEYNCVIIRQQCDHITVLYILFDLIFFAKPLKPLAWRRRWRGTLAVWGR